MADVDTAFAACLGFDAALGDTRLAAFVDAPLGEVLGVAPAEAPEAPEAPLDAPPVKKGGDMDEKANAGIDGAGTGVSWISGTLGGGTGVFC